MFHQRQYGFPTLIGQKQGSFSIVSFADNARLDARRDAEREINDTVWALAGFSVPITDWWIVYVWWYDK